MPAWEIPLRTDEHGNGLPGVKRASDDSYAALSRRTRQRPLQSTPDRKDQVPVYTPPEHSPAFAIPSGLGGCGAMPSPMDVFPTHWARNEEIPNPSPMDEEEPLQNIMDMSGWSPLTDGINLLPTPSLGAFPAGIIDSSAMLSKLMMYLTEGPCDLPEGAYPLPDIPPDPASTTELGRGSMVEGLVGPLTAPESSSPSSSSVLPPTPERGTRAEEASPPSSRTRSTSRPKAPAFQHEPYKF